MVAVSLKRGKRGNEYFVVMSPCFTERRGNGGEEPAMILRFQIWVKGALNKNQLSLNITEFKVSKILR